MLIEVKVPVLSESISEATLVSWHKKEGDYVEEDENLVDLETDKVMLEVPAPKNGMLKEIRKGDGINVSSDEVIAVIDTEQVAVANDEFAAQEEPVEKSPAAPVQAQAAAAASSGPAVKRLLEEHNLDAGAIPASGKDGRLTKGDVLSHLEQQAPVARPQAENVATVAPRAATQSQTHEESATFAQTAVRSAPPLATMGAPDFDEQRVEKRVPMSRLRARVAERLKEAQNTAAILTTFNEVDMQAIMDLRAKLKDEFVATHQAKLGFMSFFTKACVEALRQHPIINASVEDNDIIYHGFYDIGIAIGSPRGLVVPILRDADKMSFADIEKAIVAFGEKAKTGKLSLEDLSGGTFSISNGGVYGSMLSTPILNPPQSAILGMHNIQQRPVVVDGEITVRPMMYIALSYDHRIIDGQNAVTFLVSVKKALEDPVRLLLNL